MSGSLAAKRSMMFASCLPLVAALCHSTQPFVLFFFNETLNKSQFVTHLAGEMSASVLLPHLLWFSRTTATSAAPVSVAG